MTDTEKAGTPAGPLATTTPPQDDTFRPLTPEEQGMRASLLAEIERYEQGWRKVHQLAPGDVVEISYETYGVVAVNRCSCAGRRCDRSGAPPESCLHVVLYTSTRGVFEEAGWWDELRMVQRFADDELRAGAAAIRDQLAAEVVAARAENVRLLDVVRRLRSATR